MIGVIVGIKIKINNELLSKWSRTRSIEDVESELNISIPTKLRRHKRFGYPKSKFYKLITKSQILANRKEVDKLLNISN